MDININEDIKDIERKINEFRMKWIKANISDRPIIERQARALKIMKEKISSVDKQKRAGSS